MASGGSSNVENFSPQVIRGVSKELQQMLTDAPEGIRVIMNEEDITDVQAVIDGPAGTPYSGGQFRVRCVLGKDFPSAPPKAYFVTKVFHPNVSRTGEICVNTLKKDWKPDLGLKHILLTIKCLLIVPNAESALNEEAGKMLLEQYDDYCRRAKMMTEIHAAPIKRIQDKKSKESQSTETAASSSSNGSGSSSTASNSSASTSSSSSSANVSMPSKKAKVKVISRDRRRTLKRL